MGYGLARLAPNVPIVEWLLLRVETEDITSEYGCGTFNADRC